MANNLIREQHLQTLADATQQYTRDVQSETIEILTEAFQMASGSTALPVAGVSTLGMVKVGAGLSMVGDTLTLATDDITTKLNTIENKIDSLTNGNTSKIEPTISFMDSAGSNISQDPVFIDWGEWDTNGENSPLYAINIQIVSDGILCANIPESFVIIDAPLFPDEDNAPNTSVWTILFCRALGGALSARTAVFSITEGENYAAKTFSIEFDPAQTVQL